MSKANERPSLKQEIEDGDGGAESFADSLAEAGHVEVARHQHEGEHDVHDGHEFGALGAN